MNKLLRVIIILLLLAGITLVVIYREQFDAATLAAALESWVIEAGKAGPILFMVIYAIGTIFFFPGSILTLAGGALFGPVWGSLYNLTGATVGATISFLAARHLASDWVETKTAGRIKQLKEGVEGEGWRFVAFVRLVPLFPFNLLNYALGLTRISLWHYVIASYLFMLPGAIAYTYLGYAGREAIAGGEDLIQKIMLAVALLAIVGFLPSLIGRLRRGPMMSTESLKKKLDDNEDILVLDVRSDKEFVGEQGHITQSVNIAVEELLSRIDELDEYTEKTIAIVCRTDRRSNKAASILSKHGYLDVHVVTKGMTAWNEAGYDIEN